LDNPGPGDGVGITNESEPRRGYRRQSAITNQPWRCRAAQCAARGGRATVCSLLPEGLEERRVAVSAKIYVADQAVVRLIPPALAALAIRNVTYRYVSGPLVTLAGGRDSVRTTIPTRHRRMRPGAVGTAERHPDRRTRVLQPGRHHQASTNLTPRRTPDPRCQWPCCGPRWWPSKSPHPPRSFSWS